jgi:hypothetical protein
MEKTGNIVNVTDNGEQALTIVSLHFNDGNKYLNSAA